MKLNKRILLLSITAIVAVLLCSCSRNTMRRAGDTMRSATRDAENFMDNGLNAVENGVENGRNTMIGGTYGANSGYSGNAGTGTGTNYTAGGTATELNPTIRSSGRGMVNTNKGNIDGGLR